MVIKYYDVVHNMSGPYHLCNENDICLCGIRPPGFETRVDASALHDDMTLFTEMGLPENVGDFCKRCFKKAKIDLIAQKELYASFFKISQ